jgi:RNA polymerase sigma factor (sigma-70 family)
MPVDWEGTEAYDAVDDRIAARALRPALQSAVAGLPAEQQRALELRVVQQLPYEEVAGRLDCSINAARLRVSRALRSLTAQLEGAEG